MIQQSIYSPTDWYSMVYRNLHVIYICMIAPFAISMCFLLPPMQTPDEWAHFARSVSIAGGDIVGEPGEGPRSGTNLVPTSLLAFLTHPKFSPQYFLPGSTVAYTSPPHADLRELRWSNEDVAIRNPFIAYPPTSYLPGAAGIAIAKAAGLSMVPSYYLGRFVNCISALLLAVLAIYLLPRGKLIALIAFSAPSTLSLFGSYSQDAMLISFVGVAVGLLLRWHDQNSENNLALVIFASFFISLAIAARPPYIPLAILVPGYFVIVQKHYKKAAMLFALTLIYPIAWALSVSPLVYHDQFPGVNELEQIRYIFENPLNFLKLVFSSVILFKDAIGVIGSTGLAIPPYGFTLFYLACLMCFLSDAHSRSNLFELKFSVYIVLVGLGCVVLLLATSYVCWTPLHADNITRLTGRYLVPLMLLASAFFGMSSSRFAIIPARFASAPVIVALCLMVCVNFIGVITTIMAYYYIR